jgi:hypothetical protein
VTHRPIREEADGTRVYADYHRYTPVAEADRKYAVRKPDDPRAVRFHGGWFLPLEVVSDGARTMPETRPDEETLEHRARCRCDVCRRPQATVLWRRRAGATASASPR